MLCILELAAELFSEPRTGKSLERLHCHDAAKISRNACVSPCSLVLALLYLERLKKCNPDYVQRVAPSELFLISLVKFLHCIHETYFTYVTIFRWYPASFCKTTAGMTKSLWTNGQVQEEYRSRIWSLWNVISFMQW